MRVAMIDPSLFTLPYDGELSSALMARGHEVRLYGRAPQETDAAVTVAVEAHFYRLSDRLRRWPRAVRLVLKGVDHGWSLARLLPALRRFAPDIIHFQWLPLPVLDRVFLAAFRRVAPVVLTVHDTQAFNGDPSARLQGMGFRAVLRACDRLIVHTRQGEARLRGMGIPGERIAVITHGLAEAAAPGVDDAGTVTFLLFGKIKPYKGTDLLIEAFARLAPAVRARAKVRVVGQSYMDLAPLRARVTALGLDLSVAIEDRFVDDQEIDALFGPGAVAVFPYREIEISGVLFHALQHQVPVVAARIGAFGEMFEDGENGLLVPVEDVDALAVALSRMVEDAALRARCRAGMAVLCRTLPSWAEVAQSTERVYAAMRTAPRGLAPAAATAPVAVP